jgi:hypothetical protein
VALSADERLSFESGIENGGCRFLQRPPGMVLKFTTLLFLQFFIQEKRGNHFRQVFHRTSLGISFAIADRQAGGEMDILDFKIRGRSSCSKQDQYFSGSPVQ